ncbi:tetratricopeptide repeat protein [Actinacidiphila sp. bgisy167]|uniref:transglutaminase family protein n=1 Tax=Actinacidiphila sp. bgisy167 TaxID=3413797 RepID=UPI003D71DDD0
MDDTLRQRFAEAAREPRPDLAELCLLIGAAADPALDEAGTDAAQMELDRLAGLLPYGLTTAVDWAGATAELLGGRCGFGGSPADYQRLESSLLHQVLWRRRGLPILLSVVWMEVVRRVGGPIHGVALPGHFIVGFGDPAGAFVPADPFDGGRRLGEEDVRLLVAGATGAAPSSVVLEPADPLEIVLRVLNNIRAWASARPEQLATQLWTVELALLLPHHPARLRLERAQLLVRAGDFARGAVEMEAYADVLAEAEPSAAAAVRRQARAARALLN